MMMTMMKKIHLIIKMINENDRVLGKKIKKLRSVKEFCLKFCIKNKNK